MGLKFERGLFLVTVLFNFLHPMTKQDQSLVVSSVTLPRAAVCLVLMYGNMAGWMSEKYGKVASLTR